MLEINENLINKVKLNLNPFEGKEYDRYGTNCYAYALGINIPIERIKPYSYVPGCFSEDMIREPFEEDELLGLVESDLRNLEISYKIVNPDYNLLPGEWKIAVYKLPSFDYRYMGYYGDFHFLRQTDNGIWTHKKGYFAGPSMYDSEEKIIKSPDTCKIICAKEHRDKKYQYISTYCLKKVNK